MIIGKNNFINQTKEINPMRHANVLSKEDMMQRSLNILQDRLNKGHISLDEFNKKCQEINKKNQ